MNDSELLDALTRLLDAIKNADDARRKGALGYIIPETLWNAVIEAAQDARRASF